MSLTRYEFELLAYIEKYGRKDYSIREISDSLCISGTEISRCIERLSGVGCLNAKKENLSITRVGLAALEPYRVKRAIILAAGFGSRMMPATADRPKPMVTVRGVRIIDTLLDALLSAGITNITVVGGYRYDKLTELLEKYPFLRLIENREYEKTNNISSAMLALDQLHGGCYFCCQIHVNDNLYHLPKRHSCFAMFRIDGATKRCLTEVSKERWRYFDVKDKNLGKWFWLRCTQGVRLLH